MLKINVNFDTKHYSVSQNTVPLARVGSCVYYIPHPSKYTKREQQLSMDDCHTQRLIKANTIMYIGPGLWKPSLPPVNHLSRNTDTSQLTIPHPLLNQSVTF